MSVKIQKIIQLEVDLNAYYPQFSKPLRDLIDEEVVALASGRQRRKEVNLGASKGKMTPWQLLRDPENTRVYLTHAQGNHGAIKKITAALNREYPNSDSINGQGLINVIEEVYKELGRTVDLASCINNLRLGGYIRFEKEPT